MTNFASLEQESLLAQQYFAACPQEPSAVVIGIDEVGRGALAGPLMVGAFGLVFDRALVPATLPAGIKDSKLLSPKKRESFYEYFQNSTHPYAVGQALSSEIDEYGISKALTLASQRAYLQLPWKVMPKVAAVILDGNFNYFSSRISPDEPVIDFPREVKVIPKADQLCISVASASIIAKVKRDWFMTELNNSSPQYGFDKNKGYGSKMHKEAIKTLGLHPEHRKSWNLGVESTQLSFDEFL